MTENKQVHLGEDPPLRQPARVFTLCSPILMHINGGILFVF